jgi:hypothetical protein
VLLPIALAVGCSSAPGPQAKEPPPLASLLASLQPQPRPTPTSDTSAQQSAVRAYVDAVNIALRTGDTKQAKALTTSACTCRKDLKAIADVYQAKGRFVGARIDVAGVSVGTTTAAKAQLTLTYNSPPSRVVNRKGKSRAIAAKAHARWSLSLIKSSGKWLVASVATVK